MVEAREALMSTVDPSLPRLPTAVPSVRALVSSASEACLNGIRATAFWTAIPLPLVILGTLVTDVVATAPLFVGGLVLLNVFCAIIGQQHSPER